jgi:hypothetical protein
MSYTWADENVYEYKDSGIVLMKHKDVFRDDVWILVIPNGDAQLIQFNTIHFMKYKDNKLTLLVSSSKKYSYYQITLCENINDMITLDLYDWLHEKMCIQSNNQTSRPDESSSPSLQHQTCPSES